MSKIRPLSGYEAAALGVTHMSSKSDDALRRGVSGRSLVGNSDAPAFEVTDTFPLQSFLSSTLFEQAIQAQSPNDLIVPSTVQKIQVSGYAVGLHPSSQTPIAIQLDTGAQQGASPVYRLKPGEILRPHGRPNGLGSDGNFSGFRWGLPFGWLGGGSAMLVIFRTADADALWTGNPEVMFHRFTSPIYALPAALSATVASYATAPLIGSYNWPIRFPWLNARRATAGYGTYALVGGEGAIAITPTRTVIRLRQADGAAGNITLAAPADMRIFMLSMDETKLSTTLEFDDAQPTFQDITWGSFTAILGETPTQVLTGELARFGGNFGLVLPGSADPALDGLFVDFIRYGFL
jgi:hypothetical protein